MKLPKFFRSMMYISIPVFIVALILFVILLAIFGPNSSKLEDMITMVTGGVVVLSFLTMVGGIILDPLVRFTENALLRSLGRSTTATVMDFYYIESGTNKGRKLVEAVRIKLEVRDPDGGKFTGVAEDRPEIGLHIRNGQTVPVKFDPRTREVALDLPKKPKVKTRRDF
jgi:uncharacterized protein (TIGR02588 family)